MDKTAQKRTFFNKLYELANVPARSAEEYFKPQFKKIYELISNTDDHVRELLSGNAKIPHVKKLLTDSKSMVNRREYFAAAVTLGKFGDRMKQVAEVFEALNIDVSAIHHQFLVGKLPTEHRTALEEMRKRYASSNGTMFKEAGFKDFWHNVGTPRGRALALWAKRYPDIANQLKDNISEQIIAAQTLLSEVLSYLKAMASFRAGRQFQKYDEYAKKIVEAIKAYEASFKVFYKTSIVPHLEKMEAFEKKQLAETTSGMAGAMQNMMEGDGHKSLNEEMENIPSSIQTSTPSPATTSVPDLAIPAPKPKAPPVSAVLPTALPPHSPSTPAVVAPSIPAGSPNDPEVPVESPKPTPTKKTITPAEEAEKLKPARKKQQAAQKADDNFAFAHQTFIDSLEVFSNEDPTLLASHIAKYAKSIQGSHPETALELFKIVKSLRG